MGDFKNLKRVGVPYFGPNLSFEVIISKSFSWECPFNFEDTVQQFCFQENSLLQAPHVGKLKKLGHRVQPW
jgi:hypothetical protein